MREILPLVVNKARVKQEGSLGKRLWHSIPADEVLRILDTGIEGLGNDERAKRLEIYGKNEIAVEHLRSPLIVFLLQFRSILIGILIIAAVISFFIGEIIETAAIILIVLLNAVIGFANEWQAEKAIEALRGMLELKAIVITDGTATENDASKVVPGDIIVLEMGRKVPADALILSSTSLLVDEAPLTGESQAVEKSSQVLAGDTPLAERQNMVFMGTAVQNGRGQAVVVSTGMNTEFGRIAGLTASIAEVETPLARRLDELGKHISVLAIVVAAVIVITGLLQNRGFHEMFMTAVALAVAVIPEGLPAVVTLTLAIGIKQMYRRRCLIRHLSSSETLGTVSVICTDKTGTLTRNEMTLKEIYVPGTVYSVEGTGYVPEGSFFRDDERIDPLKDEGLFRFLRSGVLCNHALLVKKEEDWTIMGSPTEGSLVVAAHKAGMDERSFQESTPVMELSFNTERKRMTMIYDNNGVYMAFVKGAPEKILGRSKVVLRDGEALPLGDADIRELTGIYESMAGRGLRVLAIAERDLGRSLPENSDDCESELTFLGFAGIIDPPRVEVREALKTCSNAGIGVIMMTGDSSLTAKAVADAIGLKSDGVLTGNDIEELDDEKIAERLKKTRILARVTAEDKLRVTRVLSAKGYDIAMTGDGINDAPALKSAAVGIAMGIKGTDVAKESSDIILLDDNFESIVAGIHEGRREYENIQKFTRYLLSSNVGETVAIAVGLLMNLPLILLPLQILWINLVTDGVAALALGVEPAERDVMDMKPRERDEPILDKNALIMILIIGTWIGLLTVMVFLAAFDLDEARARTLAFTGIIIFELINVLNFRSLRSTLGSVGIMSNPYIIIALIASLLIQVLVIYWLPFQLFLHTVPLHLTDWIILIVIGIPLLAAGEIYKYGSSRKSKIKEKNLRAVS